MRIAVVGAGAIGGLLTVRLALAGHEITVVDVGKHLRAIRRHGLKLLGLDGGERTVCLALTAANPADAGPQDLVILAVKTQVLPEVVAYLPPMLAEQTVILPVQNGVPWWYFYKHGGAHDGRRIDAVDPDGILSRHVDTDRVIGCVVYPAAEIVAPGVIRHVEGDRFTLGELDNSITERASRLAATLVDAGFKSFVIEDIRGEIWLKLLGNVSFNHICALTYATMLDVIRLPATRELARQMMEESQAIANRLGITLRLPIEKRIAGAEKVGAHRPSTLQDVEAGRPLELGSQITAVLELGRLTGVSTPYTQAVHALVTLLNQTRCRT